MKDKRTDTALMASEEKYRFLVENSGDILFSLGPDFRITYISPAIERLTGHTVEEAESQTLDEMFAPPSAETMREAYRRRLRDESDGIHGDDVERWELEHKRKDGSTVWGEVTLRPLRQTDGAFAGLLGITRDITTRKRAETALRESEEKYRLVALATSDIIYEFRLADGMYTYISPNCEEILGYTPEEMSSAPYFMRHCLLDPEDFQALKRDYVAALKGPHKRLIYDFRLRCKDGRQKYLQESSAFIRDAGGRATFMIGSYKDITETKELAACLRQAQKMEAIGTLAGGIAHDFNNILTGIIGYTELTLEDDAQEDPSRRNLEQVLALADRAKNLVQQILSFSRHADQERRPVELVAAVAEALTLLRPSLPSSIEIRSHLKTGAAIVLADRTQIHQVLMNLCTNAAHAMQRGAGVLEVKLDRVDLDERSAKRYGELGPGRYQRLTVSDTGQGMDRGTIERIFEPFFTTKGPGEGTGMGLAVVHGIVKSHEGAITVHSEPGKGTTVQIYLPEINRRAGDQPSAETRPLPTGEEHILLVDDEQTIVEVGQQTLERLGYRVTGSLSAAEALDRFRRTPAAFDLVITDQTMPNLTGIHLAQELRKVRPEIPIILCSGFSQEVTVESALACGIQRFLLKPLLAREMAQAVREVLDNRSGAGGAAGGSRRSGAPA